MYHNWLNHWFVHLTGVEKMRQTCCITTHIDFQLTPGSSDTGRLIRFSTGNLVLKSENCRKLGMLQPQKNTMFQGAFRSTKDSNMVCSVNICRLSWPFWYHSVIQYLSLSSHLQSDFSVELFALKSPWHLHVRVSPCHLFPATKLHTLLRNHMSEVSRASNAAG